MYGSGSRSLTLSDKEIADVREQGAEERGWRKIHNEELHNQYCSPNIRNIKPKRMRWVGNVACMEDTQRVYTALTGKPERNRPGSSADSA